MSALAPSDQRYVAGMVYQPPASPSFVPTAPPFSPSFIEPTAPPLESVQIEQQTRSTSVCKRILSCFRCCCEKRPRASQYDVEMNTLPPIRSFPPTGAIPPVNPYVNPFNPYATEPPEQSPFPITAPPQVPLVPVLSQPPAEEVHYPSPTVEPAAPNAAFEEYLRRGAALRQQQEAGSRV